ncbi:FadR/GntR family transcriptional regulator [Falsirhodobacter deserti]|uniref:FadR/GntR family transcriptional regulator n=1 Tax=Falsirhodobacter deserti TaxID=1365611 RepID=UPI0013E31774|nr:FCD domain-containing protein [Falsirhodobacter deserti]
MKISGRHLAFEGEQRLYQIVARRLMGMIDEHRDDPDWRIPSERELAEQLEVSRPVIREAVIALEVMGHVAVRGRAGMTVLPRPAEEDKGLHRPESHEDVLQLLEARRALESGIARLAAEQTQAFGLDMLREDLARMATQEAAPFAETMRGAQISLARMTGNAILLRMEEALQDAWAASPILESLKDRLYGPALRPLWIGDHHALLAALEMAQPATACKVADRHVAHLRKEIETLVHFGDQPDGAEPLHDDPREAELAPHRAASDFGPTTMPAKDAAHR